MLKSIKCRNCSYQFNPLNEGNLRKKKCGMCCFGDSYYVRSKKVAKDVAANIGKQLQDLAK